MKITIDFANVLKFSFIVVVLLSVFSFVLSYFGIHGISISHPHENTDLRVALNHTKSILGTVAFWMGVGYLCKDYKAAVLALILTFIIQFGIDAFFPKIYSNSPQPKDLRYYLRSVSGMLIYLAFGFTHFKNNKALKLIFYWALIWGISIALSTNGFERMIEGLTRIIGWRDPFEFRISTGKSSYRPISILRILSSELFLIVKLSVFWWIYQLIKTNQSIWNGMNTFYDASISNRLTYSILYWSFRIILFVTGFGLVTFIAHTFRLPFDMLMVIRILMGTFALIVLASIYRNLLVSHFVQQNKYPGGQFFLLNIPIVNLFAWMYSLVMFNNPSRDEGNIAQIQQNFEEQKSEFNLENRNGGWKVLIIVITLFSMLYQLNRAGFRLDGPSRDGAFAVLIISMIVFTLLLFFLYNKNAFIPLMAISCAGILLTTIWRNESLLYPTMATSLINLVLFYGMFYFDELKLSNTDEPDFRDELE
jgi:hypothetical protein